MITPSPNPINDERYVDCIEFKTISNDSLKPYVPNIMWYYHKTLDQPKFISERDMISSYSKPSLRPSLRGLDVVVYASCNIISLLQILYYACEEHVTSIHIAFIADEVDRDGCIKYINKYKQSFDKYQNMNEVEIMLTHKYSPFDEVLHLDNISFIPREFDRLLNSLTMHVFDRSGEIVA